MLRAITREKKVFSSLVVNTPQRYLPAHGCDSLRPSFVWETTHANKVMTTILNMEQYKLVHLELFGAVAIMLFGLRVGVRGPSSASASR
jgi:hypothetical protein